MDHSGHRERLKKSFAESGFEGFDEAKALEMLLFYVIPRRDTAPIAHGLLQQFGSLMDVLDAPVEALAQSEGMGESSALYLRFIMSVYRYYIMRRNKKDTILDTVEKCGEFLLTRFLGRQEEVVYVLCLNTRCNPVGCKMMGEGGINSANVPIRRIVEYALSTKASSVVLAHNHPGGVALPSAQDVASTRRVAEALDAVGIVLADHLVLTNEDYTSMAESGLLCGVGHRGRKKETEVHGSGEKGVHRFRPVMPDPSDW